MGQPGKELITHVIAQRFHAGRRPPHVPALAWHVDSGLHPTRNVVLVKSLNLVSGASEDQAWLRGVEAYVVTTMLSKTIGKAVSGRTAQDAGIRKKLSQFFQSTCPKSHLAKRSPH